VNSGFAGRGEVEVAVAVAVQVFNDELGADSCGAVHRDRVAGELTGFAVDLVVVDNQRIIRARVVAIVTAITLAGEQFGFDVAINIDQLECVTLREGFVDDVFDPGAMACVALLLEPIEAVAMAVAFGIIWRRVLELFGAGA
jgi:hypothetical protein